MSSLATLLLRVSLRCSPLLGHPDSRTAILALAVVSAIGVRLAALTASGADFPVTAELSELLSTRMFHAQIRCMHPACDPELQLHAVASTFAIMTELPGMSSVGRDRGREPLTLEQTIDSVNPSIPFTRTHPGEECATDETPSLSCAQGGHFVGWPVAG